MNAINKMIALILISGLFFTISCNMGSQPNNFTATMEVAGMGMEMAQMGNRVRVDNPMMADVVTLSLGDKKMAVTLNTSSKKFFQEPIKDDSPSVYDANTVIEKKKVGTDNIDGHACVKYDAVMYTKDNPDKKFDATIWEAKDLKGLVIRTDMSMNGSQKMSTLLRNVQLGAATADMFQVPEDYTEVTSMAEVMGMPTPGNLQEGMKKLGDMFKKMGGD